MTPDEILALARSVDWFTVLDSIGVHLNEYGYEPDTEARVKACETQVRALIEALQIDGQVGTLEGHADE